jgi:hypothetical protein
MLLTLRFLICSYAPAFDSYRHIGTIEVAGAELRGKPALQPKPCPGIKDQTCLDKGLISMDGRALRVSTNFAADFGCHGDAS